MAAVSFRPYDHLGVGEGGNRVPGFESSFRSSELSFLINTIEGEG